MRKVIVFIAALAMTLTACGSTSSDEPAVSGEPAPTSTTSPVATSPEEVDAPADTTPTTIGEESTPDGQEFPDVLEARATRDADGTFTFDVTLSSPYDTPQRYADAWRVLGPDGTEYGIRVLTHDHGSEQPFTRSQSGVEVPEGVETVTIEGRDLANGWGGTTVEVAIPPLDY